MSADSGLDSLAPGQTIGSYQILSQIGQGGMATVYKAYHPAMDRYVALKVLPRQLAASREFTGRFEHEARLIARLEHAHILPVHDYGTADGYTYLAMRYVEAGTLKDRLRAGPLTPDEIDRFFTQLADALDYAHTLGVIHRDLKPSNVLLDKRGNLFLTDFGIAKLLEGSPEFTTTGAMIGTPAYMSPEQAQGVRVDLRTDIYSLGVVLYEMVTGRVPYEADTPLAVILKHVNEPLPLPSSIKPDVPPAVERVLLKALAKQREDRFATTADFIAAWQAARPALRAAAQAPAPSPHTVGATAATAPPPKVSPPAATAAAMPSAPQAASSHASLPLASAAPHSHAPASRSRRRLALLGVAGASLLLVVGLLACGALALLWFNNQNAGGVAPTQAPVPTAGGEGTLQSWAAGNTIWAVALTGDGQLITGGPGSVAGWDMTAGAPETQLTGADGLPSPHVNALLFEPDTGLLWIATADGLVSTDGQDLTVYRQQAGLDSSTVIALAPSSQGLLAGTAYGGFDGAGLNRLTPDGWQPMPDFPSLDAYDDEHLSTYVTAILEDGDGDLWVGTESGLGRYDGSEWTRYALDEGLPGLYITALAEIDGDVWAGTSAGPARFDGEAFEVVPDLEGWWVHGILGTTAGEVWVSLGGGLVRWTGAGANWRFYEPNVLPSYDVFRGVEAPDGTLYFGTGDGVLLVAGDERPVWQVPNVPAAPAFGAIQVGPEAGQLWFVEEYGDRVDVFDLNAETWLPGPELDCDYCVPLARDAQGRLWAGGDLGLWIFDADGNPAAHLTTAQGLPVDGVWGVAFAPTGEAYLATNGGVAVYDGSTVTAVYDADSAGLSDDDVHGVWVTSDGALWAAAEKAISRLDLSGEWTHFGAGNPFEYEVWVSDLVEGADGAVWLTTGGEGAFRYADGVWTQYSPATGAGLPTTDVNCVALAPDGSLWFGLYYEGAARFDGTTWEVFQIEDGLVHSNVNDVFVDELGNVWFATSGGVSRYRP